MTAERAQGRALWRAFRRAQRLTQARARYETAPQPTPASPTEAEQLRMRIDLSRGDTDEITRMSLGLAVPIWIDRMRDWRPAYRQLVAHELVEVTAFEQGSAAMCDPDAALSSKLHRPGEMTGAFNAVAQGLACLAFCPGGVVFAGHHWEALTATPTSEAPTVKDLPKYKDGAKVDPGGST